MLRHDNLADMNRLALRVEEVPEHMRYYFSASLLAHNLMRGPWWFRALHWIVKKIKGWDDLSTWHLLLFNFDERIPDFTTDIISAFSDHIRNGQDLSDRRNVSVGGLNQKKVDLTAQLVIMFTPAVYPE